MIGVAWCMCALLVLVRARIYERCELARELMELGINHVDISTWVCIAFHESRLDTGANNLHSGDHGIFQISELFWCGKGKACHLPCSALKDDDITDDMECALQIHEEHTRLQGDGFLAWVVYPHHCKQNTKKYIADCDNQLKRPIKVTAKSRPRMFNTYYDSSFYDLNYTSENFMMGEESSPPFLVISKIFRANYGKFDVNKNGRFDWLNYKIDNIDDLKLPVFDKPEVVTIPTTTTTTSSITYAPVKPWRTIETNQFRHKNKSQERSTVKPVTLTTSTSTTQNTIHRPTTTKATTFKPILVTSGYSLSKTTKKPYDIPSSTRKSIDSTRSTYSFKPWTYTSTFKPHTIKTTKRTSPMYPTAKSTISTKSTELKSISTYRPFTIYTLRTTTDKPLQSTTAITTTVRPLQTTASRTTTVGSLQLNTIRTTTGRHKQSTTVKPFLTTSTQTRTQTNSYESRPSSSKSKTAPLTTKHYSFASTSTIIPPKLTTASPKITTAIGSSPTKTKVTAQTTRMTQSIFDLYLNPTKRPKLPSYNFSSIGNSRSIVIFSGGTTANPTLKPTTRAI